MIVKDVDRLVPKQLYACVFDGENENTFVKKYNELTDAEFAKDFFSKNKYKISSYLRKEYGISAEKSKRWAEEAVEQAENFFDRITSLIVDASNGKPVDFSKEFELYKIYSNYQGLKVYGPKYSEESSYIHSRQSLLRLWALEIDDAYLIVYAGIKLDYKIENCADLNVELEPRFKAAAQYLQSRNIFTVADLDKVAGMMIEGS